MGNIFIGGQDPLLGGNYGGNYQEQMAELLKAQQVLNNKVQNLQQIQAPQSLTPTWDEIDRVTGAMSEKEFEMMTQNEEFKESQQKIDAITQVVLMKALRPMIENTKEGKDALDNHLTLVNRLKKSVAKEADAELIAWREYKEKYSHMSYDEYLKAKGGKV